MEQTLLSPNDHDLLIENRVDVRDIKKDIKDIKDGISAQLNDHEGRIKKLETLVDQTNPLEKLKEFDTLQKQFIEQTLAAKFERRNWSVIGGVISALLVTLLEGLILHFVGKI